MSYFRRIHLNDRPKKFLQGANMTKQYLYFATSTGTGSGTTGGGGSEGERSGDELICYIEFDFDTVISKSDDFSQNLKNAVAALGYDTGYFSFTVTTAYQVNTIPLDNTTRIVIKNDLLNTDAFFDDANTSVANLKTDIENNNLSIDFTQFTDSQVLTAEPRLSIESDFFHSKVYRYNKLYNFETNPDIELKLVPHDYSTTNSVIYPGDKVYVSKANGKYLISDMADDRKSFIDGEIKWSTEPQYRLLFEVHAYRNPGMDQDYDKIDSSRSIPNDYGFKLEILPMNIQGVFQGLSEFVTDYEFENDGTYTLIDNDFTGFNISHFYEDELGQRIPPNDESIPDIEYNIDECFLTFRDGNYGFTFENAHQDAILFYDGTEQ